MVRLTNVESAGLPSSTTASIISEEAPVVRQNLCPNNVSLRSLTMMSVCSSKMLTILSSAGTVSLPPVFL